MSDIEQAYNDYLRMRNSGFKWGMARYLAGVSLSEDQLVAFRAMVQQP
jgi:hypothetical protein